MLNAAAPLDGEGTDLEKPVSVQLNFIIQTQRKKKKNIQHIYLKITVKPMSPQGRLALHNTKTRT